MLKLTHIGFCIFLIISITLAGTAFILPKDELIIDNFEDNDISDWDESGFETESYIITNTKRGSVANIEIKTGQDVICKQDTPPIYCKYGSFQKNINKNFKGYNKISYWISFSNNYENLDRIKLSFGDIVSGAIQENKIDYYYIPKSNEWQLVTFNLNNPDSTRGDLDLKHVKKLRFNIEYGEDFYESNQTFHVYFDNIKLTKYSATSLTLFTLSIISLVLSLILLFWRETRRKLRRINRVISNLSNKRRRADSFKKIINSTFQLLLIIFLILLLTNEFYPIKFLNLNYFLIIVLIFGIISVLLPKDNEIIYKSPTRVDYFLIPILGIVGGILIYIKTKDLGMLSYIISTIAGILIIMLSYLVLEEEEDEIQR